MLSEAVERIFPEDDLGPGAKKLGVAIFINNELAGNYGSGAKNYRFGPFIQGKKNQGYQYPLTRAELFKMGGGKCFR
ncbi:gluconate 2-dehydrogenase subunit 3 family protein [Campylobacter jejuni]|uniref:gluconate 2-dehydrogenase subunit 3 family protein n=1 Tax=Campylobacter jejuni TaxID=197 RepID=UPI0018E20D5D|nr:gluconate 2-dehydrogenase subunit 3 family protein [Campylobacter jejuni]MBX0908691.1 gluconate 2-dehydrogenase subunit 3 family protein [Campylobacter jejuni]MBX1049225.1 gluconate 2-dehydrogenase subunit 3 family protein [Campylobacter jejuni]MBX1394027.1 gluconate 2-dehydrogenase subunit 3 family protein [Campylobacter jejuni]MBX1678925.1 gluconate 2-dehydrogenase subunit 3 family protein [Campylobacter jejuni]